MLDRADTTRVPAPSTLSTQTTPAMDRAPAEGRPAWLDGVRRANRHRPTRSAHAFDLETALDHVEVQSPANLAAWEAGAGSYTRAHEIWAHQRLSEILARHPCPGLSDPATRQGEIVQTLAVRLRRTALQTATLLMHTARLSGQLAGDTPEDRATAFGELLRDRDYRLECARRFPQLDAQLATITEDAVANWATFFQRLAADWPYLDDLAGVRLGQILSLGFYAGDPHNRGQCVVIVQCHGGKVVYKPRPLDTDVVLGRTLDWLEKRLGLGLKHLRILARDAYGWTEFVSAEDCADTAAVSRCYTRQGALLGALHILGGSDIHYENLICAGELPYVIDAEALLGAPLRAADPQSRRYHQVNDVVVTRIGLLPSLTPVGKSTIDSSAMGYAAGQVVEFDQVIRPNGRDDVEAGPASAPSPASFNRPTLAGVLQSAPAHVEAIEVGLRDTLGVFLAHRDEFLTRPDLLPAFAGVRSRFVARATARYMEALKRCNHPHAAVSLARQTDAFRDTLVASNWPREVAAALIAAEITALRQGDVPYFHGRSDSTDVFDADGARVTRVFRETGVEAVRRRLLRLNPQVINQQAAIARLALSAALHNTGARAQPRAAPASQVDAAPDALLRTARAIGDHILSMAIDSGTRLHWMGRRTVEGKRSGVAFMGADLYSGVGGVAVFLARLAKATQEPRYRRRALRCLEMVRADRRRSAGGIGGFDGLAGSLYVDLLVSDALERPHGPDLPAKLSELTARVADDTVFDIVSGSAGVLLVALGAHATPGLASPARDLAKACRDQLMRHAMSVDNGVAWRPSNFHRALTGLAHGASGAALALAEYAHAFEDEAAMATAMAGLAFERGTFDAARGLWPDLRFEDSHTVAWCHGACGMTLARQRIAELNPHAGLEEDIALGLDALMRERWPTSDSLCHDRGGNWEPLWKAGGAWSAHADRDAQTLCADWAQGIMPVCELSEPTCDLMTGLAGVGYQLLRAFDPSTPIIARLGR